MAKGAKEALSIAILSRSRALASAWRIAQTDIIGGIIPIKKISRVLNTLLSPTCF